MPTGIRLKAILWGLATDIGATYAAMIALGIFIGVQAGMENMPRDEAKQFLESIPQEPRFLLIGVLVGLLGTVLGGYVAAKIANSAPLLNAGCVGVVLTILGIFFIGDFPLQIGLIGTILTLPAALVGGFLGR